MKYNYSVLSIPFSIQFPIWRNPNNHVDDVEWERGIKTGHGKLERIPTSEAKIAWSENDLKECEEEDDLEIHPE